jgi:uncharacterized protein (TIGR03437 family)
MRRVPVKLAICGLPLLVLLGACSANDDIPAPALSDLVPAHAPPGAVVELDGNYFCQRPETGQDDPTCAQSGTVEFGTVPANSSLWSDTAVMASVPEGLTGSVDVSVSAAGRTSNTVSFTVD